MIIKRWLALICAAMIGCMSLCLPALAEDEPPAAVEPAPKPAEKKEEKPAEKPAEPPAPAPTEKPTEKPAETQAPAPTEKPAEKPAETQAPASTEAPTEKPAEPPAPAPTEAPTEKPAEPPAPAPTEAPAEEPAGTQAPAPTETPAGTEPEAAPTESPATSEPTATAEPAATAAPAEAPAEAPAGATPEPTAVPEPLSMTDFSADRASVAPGETVRFSYRTTGAESVKWHVQRSDGEASESGEAGPDGFSWTPGRSGVYTMAVTACAGKESTAMNAVVTVRAGGLKAEVKPGVRYAMIGERALRYELAVSGGVEPYTVRIVIEAKGKKVFAADVLSALVTFSPKVFADHTLKLTVTDAVGAGASAKATIRVSTNKTNEALKLPALAGGLNYAERLVAVAKSQVGYQESKENFIIEKGGKVQGWSVYGSAYGMPYEEWCAMFVSWCLDRAGIPEWMMPQSANCWRLRLSLGSRYDDSEREYTPEPGDLIFFHHDREDSNRDANFPNHIGIVTDYSERWQTVYTVEGNSGGKVAEKKYALSDGSIVGYTSMRYVMERWDPHYVGEPEEASDGAAVPEGEGEPEQ